MGKAKQPVSVDGIEFDALIESSESYETNIPEYPTERGFSISDTIILNPRKLEMTLFLTDTPVTWRKQHGNDLNRVQTVIKKLEELYFERKAITVVTTDKTYPNMAIESMTITKSLETGYAREIPISFKEIRVTESVTVTIPDSYGKSGASGTNAGAASTTKTNQELKEPEKKKSILKGIADSAGSFLGF